MLRDGRPETSGSMDQTAILIAVPSRSGAIDIPPRAVRSPGIRRLEAIHSMVLALRDALELRRDYEFDDTPADFWPAFGGVILPDYMGEVQHRRRLSILL